MKILNTLLLTLCLLVGTSQPVNAIITGANTYFGTLGNKQITVSVLQSTHIDTLEQTTTKQQHEQLAKIALALKAGICAEDQWDYDGENEEVAAFVKEQRTKQRLCLLPRTTFKIKGIPNTLEGSYIDSIFGIMKTCKKLGIPAYNAECRFYGSASFQGENVKNIIGPQIINEFKKFADEIIDCTKDYAFMEYPPLYIKYFEKNAQGLILLRNIHKPLRHLTLEEDACINGDIGFELVEMRMLHALNVLDKCPHIILCSGKLHADTINKILPKLGLKKIHEKIDSSIKNEGDIELDPLNIPQYFTQLEEILTKQRTEKSDKEKKV